MNRVQLVVFLSFDYNPSSEGIWPVCLDCLSLIRVTNMIEIPHQIQKSFSPVSSINSSQTDIALPAKTSKPNFVTFFVYFGDSSFGYL